MVVTSVEIIHVVFTQCGEEAIGVKELTNLSIVTLNARRYRKGSTIDILQKSIRLKRLA